MKILDMNLCRWKNYIIFLCKHTLIPLVRVQGYAGVWTSNTLPLPFIPLTQKHRGVPLPLSCLIHTPWYQHPHLSSLQAPCHSSHTFHHYHHSGLSAGGICSHSLLMMMPHITCLDASQTKQIQPCAHAFSYAKEPLHHPYPPIHSLCPHTVACHNLISIATDVEEPCRVVTQHPNCHSHIQPIHHDYHLIFYSTSDYTPCHWW